MGSRPFVTTSPTPSGEAHRTSPQPRTWRAISSNRDEASDLRSKLAIWFATALARRTRVLA